MRVLAIISFFFQFHTITTDPIQPLTINSGFRGWNFTAQGVRGWPINVYIINKIKTINTRRILPVKKSTIFTVWSPWVLAKRWL